MESELPWNVAGIPPEAREAARASARREGLSVGEWLTRRILHSLAEAELPPQSLWESERPATRRAPLDHFAADQSQEILTRVARSQLDSQNAWVPIEEQLKNLARRVEQSELIQAEITRSATRADAEHEIETRQQTLALDRIDARSAHLNERLLRIEQRAQADGASDAILALRQGLSRLADQVAQTAAKGGDRTAEIARTLETLSDRLAAYRSEEQEASRVFAMRIAALETSHEGFNGPLIADTLDAVRENFERCKHEQQQSLLALAERISTLETSLERFNVPLLSTNLSSVSERLGRCENEQQQRYLALAERISSVETTLKSLQTRDLGRSDETNKLNQQGDALAKLSSTVDAVSRQFAAAGTQRASAEAHLDERLSRIEAQIKDGISDRRLQSAERSITDLVARVERSESEKSSDVQLHERLSRIEAQLGDGVSDRRLQSIEIALTDVMARLERSEREKSGIAETIEDELRNLVLRMDAAEKHNREAIAELGVLVKEASARIEHAVFEPRPAEPVQIVTPPAETALPAPETSVEIPSPAPARPMLAFASEPSAGPLLREQVRADVQSFMAAARRNMRDASAVQTESTFTWPFFARAKAALDSGAGDRSRLRMFLLAGLAFVVVAATSAGLFLSQATLRPQANSVSRLVAKHGTNRAVVAHRTPAAPRDRITSLATQGDPKAEELLGLRYLDGDGVRVNEAEGAKWLERAAAHGEPVAAYRLGTLYEHGHGVPADPSRAAMWYVVAAKGGNRKAMHNLAVAYAEGVGVPKNPALAAQWFSRAADLGLADSQFNLGVLYERGLGVQQSLVDAYKWYAIAAAEGDNESRARIIALSSQLDIEDRVAATRAANAFRVQPENPAANAPPDASALLGG